MLLGTFCPVTHIMGEEHFPSSYCDTVFLLTLGSIRADGTVLMLMELQESVQWRSWMPAFVAGV